MRKRIEGVDVRGVDYRIPKTRESIQKLYASGGDISHLASGSGGDVFVSEGDGDRVVYKVRRIDAKARPDYWKKEALLLQLLSEKGFSPKLVGYLPDTTEGGRKVIQKRLELDLQTVQSFESRLDDGLKQRFEGVTEARAANTPIDTGVIRMQYIENDPVAFHELREKHPDEISRQIDEISTFLRRYKLYPSDVELVFDGMDGKLKFRDVGGFRVCGLREGDWEEEEDVSGTLIERMHELLVEVEKRSK